MASAKVTTKKQTGVPLYKGGWNTIVESTPVYKETGDAIAKANKSTVIRKGALPLFRYIKESGGEIGEWYKLSDLKQKPKISAEDKALIKEYKESIKDVEKEWRERATTKLALKDYVARLTEYNEAIASIEALYE